MFMYQFICLVVNLVFFLYSYVFWISCSMCSCVEGQFVIQALHVVILSCLVYDVYNELCMHLVYLFGLTDLCSSFEDLLFLLLINWFSASLLNSDVVITAFLLSAEFSTYSDGVYLNNMLRLYIELERKIWFITDIVTYSDTRVIQFFSLHIKNFASLNGVHNTDTSD